jgi:hypothetical protein
MALTLTAHEACLKMAQTCITTTQQYETREVDVEVLVPDSTGLRGDARLNRGTWLLVHIADCGNYGDPPNFSKWAVQVRAADVKVSYGLLCERVVKGAHI